MQLPAGVEPAHLCVKRLGAQCAQDTLNLYLTHVKSPCAAAAFPSSATRCHLLSSLILSRPLASAFSVSLSPVSFPVPCSQHFF